MRKFILASASSERRRILARYGFRFKAIPAGIDESFLLPRVTSSPARLVRKLALEKAEKVARKFGKGLVVGADTIAVLAVKKNRSAKFHVIGKPKSSEQAREILRRLSGTTHEVYSGLAIIDTSTGKKLTGHEVSTVKMKKLGEKEILKLSRAHLDKAGAYGIEGRNDRNVEILKGSLDNIRGMPLRLLKRLLSRFSQ